MTAASPQCLPAQYTPFWQVPMFAFNLRVAVNMAIWRYGYMALWRYALGIQYSWMGLSHICLCVDSACMHASWHIFESLF